MGSAGPGVGAAFLHVAQSQTGQSMCWIRQWRERGVRVGAWVPNMPDPVSALAAACGACPRPATCSPKGLHPGLVRAGSMGGESTGLIQAAGLAAHHSSGSWNDPVLLIWPVGSEEFDAPLL